MSTSDGQGQDEPRYGRRLPDGQRPPPYGQHSGQPDSSGWYGQQSPGQPGGSGDYGQQGGHGAGHPAQPGYPGGYGQQPGGYGAPSPYGQPASGQPGGPPGGYAPGGYGQQYGSYGPGGYGPSGPPPKRTGAVVTLVIGALLMIGAPIVGFFLAIASATDSISGIATDGAQLTNGSSVDLPANVERMVIFEASSITPGTVSCDVTDPGGRSLPVSDTIEAFGAEDVPLPGVSFQTTAAGSYTITCDLPSNVNQSLIVTPPLDFGSLVSSGMTVLIGLAVGFLGFIALIIGIVWLVRVNKRIRTGQY